MGETNSHSTDIVIVGAGHAGGTAAALLRQYGHDGRVTLIGDEPLAPYQRPPLSKAWLKGEADAESLALKPPAFYAENDIDLRLDTSAVAIDRTAHQVLLADGTVLPYGRLILATGARAIVPPLPRVDSKGIHVLRTAADAEALKAGLAPGRHLLIVGAGYIGLEVAASARALGAEVTVLEREPRILSRVANGILSDFFHRYHAARGVRFELNCTVAGFGSDGARVSGAWLSDGRGIGCDAVLLGVGARPNDALARACGLDCEGGILVDLDARTSDPDIFAIGDVTRRPMPLYDCLFRLESVPNALEQARQAVAAITGQPAPAGEVPWQWSDQYDLKLQIAGFPFGADRIVVRGAPEAAKFALFHLRGRRILAVEAINSPAEFMAGRQLIGNRKTVDPERLIDPTLSMKEVAAEARLESV